MKYLIVPGFAVAVAAVLVALLMALFVPPAEKPLVVEPPSVAEPVDTPAAPLMPPNTTPATVDYVHDGDTLFLTDGTKVRLLAVDTPEVGDRAECYGDEARAYLRALLPEGSTVYTLADVEPRDQYGRSLLFLWTESGELVNYSLVAGGYAEALFIGGNRLYEDEIEAAEDVAMDAGAGIWGSC